MSDGKASCSPGPKDKLDFPPPEASQAEGQSDLGLEARTGQAGGGGGVPERKRAARVDAGNGLDWALSNQSVRARRPGLPSLGPRGLVVSVPGATGPTRPRPRAHRPPASFSATAGGARTNSGGPPCTAGQRGPKWRSGTGRLSWGSGPAAA